MIIKKDLTHKTWVEVFKVEGERGMHREMQVGGKKGEWDNEI